MAKIVNDLSHQRYQTTINRIIQAEQPLDLEEIIAKGSTALSTSLSAIFDNILTTRLKSVSQALTTYLSTLIETQRLALQNEHQTLVQSIQK